jgi:uncharacterized protein
MPLGGLKWRSELEGKLEKKEFKKIKSDPQVMGIASAPFSKDGQAVKIVAVLSRGSRMLEGVFHSEIKKDGLDATDKIICLVKDIKRENARAILLDGLTCGGFNPIDIKRIYNSTHIPVIVSMQKRPDHAKINDGLRNLDEKKLRTDMIKAAGKVHEIKLDSARTVFVQVAGIDLKDATEIIKNTTPEGLIPEPLNAAHMIGRGAYEEIEHKDLVINEPPHVAAFNLIKHHHKKIKRAKIRYLPGAVGEIASFLFAVLIAWLLIQGMGWALGTSTPLVVVESESMVHESGNWDFWHDDNGLDTSDYGFLGGMNIGDIILIKGDNPDDIQVGDVIVYSKLSSQGSEPIIHRVTGIVEVNDQSVRTKGAVKYAEGKIKTPCNTDNGYGLEELNNFYGQEGITKAYPNLRLDSYRLFITKGDNNEIEDQCKQSSKPLIFYPIHEELILGRAKLDIPYLGYVKLGIVCAYRYATGNVCDCRCWWAADNGKCCRNEI